MMYINRKAIKNYFNISLLKVSRKFYTNFISATFDAYFLHIINNRKTLITLKPIVINSNLKF